MGARVIGPPLARCTISTGPLQQDGFEQRRASRDDPQVL